jgi:hypothetical protein
LRVSIFTQPQAACATSLVENSIQRNAIYFWQDGQDMPIRKQTYPDNPENPVQTKVVS